MKNDLRIKTYAKKLILLHFWVAIPINLNCIKYKQGIEEETPISSRWCPDIMLNKQTKQMFELKLPLKSGYRSNKIPNTFRAVEIKKVKYMIIRTSQPLLVIHRHCYVDCISAYSYLTILLTICSTWNQDLRTIYSGINSKLTFR